MTNPMKDDWVQLFKDNVVKLRYEDRDGNLTERSVTLNEQHISYQPSANPNKRTVLTNNTTIVVWDIDKQMWRRLKIDNIMFVKAIEPVAKNEQTEE